MSDEFYASIMKKYSVPLEMIKCKYCNHADQPSPHKQTYLCKVFHYRVSCGVAVCAYYEPRREK